MCCVPAEGKEVVNLVLNDDENLPTSATWLAVEGQAPVRLDFTDELRPGAADCVAMLRKARMRVMLISGDRLASVLGRLLRPVDAPAGARAEGTETTS